MTSVLFTNVRIFDGTGALAYPGEVLVQGNRISRIARGARALPTAGVTTVDGGGATLMPGLVEAHTHFSWNDQPGLSEIQRMPTEEHILWCAHIAKRYLDMGVKHFCIGTDVSILFRWFVDNGKEMAALLGRDASAAKAIEKTGGYVSGAEARVKDGG